QNLTRPVDRPPGMRIKLRGFIESGGDAVVISPNCQSVQLPNSVNRLVRIRTVAHDIAATKYRIVTSLLCPLGAGFKRFDIGMDVTQDEVAHGVLWLACDSRR